MVSILISNHVRNICTYRMGSSTVLHARSIIFLNLCSIVIECFIIKESICCKNCILFKRLFKVSYLLYTISDSLNYSLFILN